MQPIYVEVSDEITTVIERLKAVKEKSVALVIPKGAILLQSIINLKLAKKAALDAGKEITLVTTDKIGRNLAAQVGLAVISRLDEPVEESVDTGTEPSVIDGVKIHRYYDEQSPESEDLPVEEEREIAPIIPRQILREQEEKKSKVESDAPVTLKKKEEKSGSEPLSENAQPIIIPEKPVELIPPLAADNPTENDPPATPPPSTVKKEKAVLSEEELAQRKKKRRKLGFFFLYLCILALLAAGGVGAFYLPQTTVTIGLASEPWNKDFSTTAKVGANNPADKTLIPAELITVEVIDKITFKATGTKDVGEKAKGSAQIFNGYSSTPQDLAAGTTVAANGLYFTTDSAITIPGAQVENGKPVPGSATVAITANQAGEGSNLSGVTGTVPQTNLYAQIISTTGGNTKQLSVVTQTDIANARIALDHKLQATAKNKINDQLKGRSVLANDKNDSFNLDSFTPSVLAGTEADIAEASAKETAKRLVVDSAALKTSIQSRLSETQDKDHTWITDSITPGSLDVKMAEQTITIQTNAKGRLTQKIETEAIRSQLVGKHISDGISLIKLIDKNAKVSVEQKPAWWPLKNFPYSPQYLQVQLTDTTR